MKMPIQMRSFQSPAVFVAPEGGDSGVLTRNILAACAYAGVGAYFGPELIADTITAVEQTFDLTRFGRPVTLSWDYASNFAFTTASAMGVPAHIYLALRAGRSDPSANQGAPLS